MTSVVNNFFLFLFCSLLLAGCQSQTQPIHEIKGDVFGSYFLIKYRGSVTPEELRPELDKFFKEFNNEFSTYQPNSIISQLNHSPPHARLKVTARFIQMMKLAKALHEQTQGAFDPTLGPVIRAWGFGGGKDKKVPSSAELAQAMKRVGFHHFKWDESKWEVWKTNDCVLDVNGFAPGWAADLIGEMLIEKSIQDFMIDISGEILFRGKKSNETNWVAGIEKPTLEYATGVQLAFKIENQAIATSGNYRQFFDDKGQIRSHIIDPKSGQPTRHRISSASVLAVSAAYADAWSTALMVLGEEGLEFAEKNGIKAYLIRADGPQQFVEVMSPGMKLYYEANQLK
jgi:FAD:protein FMN transferase